MASPHKNNTPSPKKDTEKNTTLSPLQSEEKYGKIGVLWGGVRPGTEGYALFSHLQNLEEGCFLIVVKDALRARLMVQSLQFFLPSFSCQELPSWDSHPFEKMSPSIPIAATRMAILSSLALPPHKDKPKRQIIVTTLRSFIQKVPHQNDLTHAHIVLDSHFQRGEKFESFLQHYGFERTDVVRTLGEYAVRGGLIDIFPPGEKYPLRCDFFGDTLESIHTFDPVTQRRLKPKESAVIFGASELSLDSHTRSLFTSRYRKLALLQNCVRNEELVEAIKEGHRIDGIEYWLGLLSPQLQNLVDFCQSSQGHTKIIFSDNINTDDLFRLYEDIDNANQERHNVTKDTEHHYPHPPTDSLYVSPSEWKTLEKSDVIGMVSHASPLPEQKNWQKTIHTEAGYDFLADRKAGHDIYKKLASTILDIHKNKTKKVVILFENAKTGSRIAKILHVHGVRSLMQVKTYEECLNAAKGMVCVTLLPMEAGFQTENTVFITQQDIIGSTDAARTARQKSSRSGDSLSESSSLHKGELVVHNDYGIGRYEALEEHSFENHTMACLRISYRGGDCILLPVHNMDLLSRYGSGRGGSGGGNEEGGEGGILLDKLGGTAWQARKLKAKKKIMEMAHALLETEATRHTKTTTPYLIPEGPYHEFCALFPHTETPDQERAEEDVLDDLASTKPMDRLICGDVGFGKTEIAMRATFTVVSSGDQVVIIAPTTLLAHQHYRTFVTRFQGFGIKIGLLSRFVKSEQARNVKASLADGSLHIAIGTHALLSQDIKIANPGLVILDEEQLFGVVQKEKLKRWKTHVHILSMSATPIPRTLQMALSGVRAMSMITTPPVNRHAIRTYVSVEDDMMIRRAIHAEIQRDGKIYYVCPHISDIANIAEKLNWLVPEARVITAHGRMKGSLIEDAMKNFIDGDTHILLATPIVGAGLDVSQANTMIIHRAHLFGLAPLHQLRGRVGRSSTIAHCYLTTPTALTLSSPAKKRIDVMRTHDSLGTGFNLASHDLDLRGAGNLLGSDQSGHIREVGVELYQKMLKDTLQLLQQKTEEAHEQDWSPQVQLGFDALIPEDYIPDMGLRLQIYQKLGNLRETAPIAAMKHEINDRFGPLPPSVHGLLHVMVTRINCFHLRIEKLNAHKNGISISFKNNSFAEPEKLLLFLDEKKSSFHLNTQHQIIGQFNWRSDAARLRGVNRILDDLKDLISP